ncbi:MAG: hypothetical protein ACI8U3_002145 [Brevundimonas sp.]|jgi:hypothetical protein|uniref:hypothetical protein n=1 Tax=Brevundimonas sp. TaxID=1871086 RepID=UPI0039E527EA
MNNPFLRRATEYIRDDSAFLAIVSPEALTAFIGGHPRRSAIFDLPVRVIGSPGSGKTMMASMVEFRRVEAILRDQRNPNHRTLAAALAATGFVQDGRPAVAAVRLPMEAEYREFWELPYDAGLKTRLVLSLIQARFVQGLIRNLTGAGRRHSKDIRFVAREDSEALLAQIGGLDAEAMLDRALEVEQAVYRVGASLLPPGLDEIPDVVREPYQPFEALRHVEIEWQGETLALKPLVILDDAHTLHPDQFDGLFRILLRREMRIARWVMMRLDALSPSAVFRSRDEETLPGVKRDRDYLDIFMQSDGERDLDRRRFRSMAADMADRYLPLVKTLRDRNYVKFSPLLIEEPPMLSDAKLRELEKDVDRAQKMLELTPERREKIDALVKRYVRSAKGTDLGVDVRLAMVRVLMHRHAGRAARQPSLFGDDPDPKQPMKVKSDVAEAARLFLHEGYGRPLHYGLETICDAADENAELFLQLAGGLVERMETRAIRNQDPALSAAQQQAVLKERGDEIIESWAFPYVRKVRTLVDAIADACLEVSLKPNASLGAGAKAVGIPEDDMELLLGSKTELAEVLKYAIAYSGLVAVRNYNQGNKRWCLLELPGPACLKFGLTLKRGGFLEWQVEELAAIVDHS